MVRFFFVGYIMVFLIHLRCYTDAIEGVIVYLLFDTVIESLYCSCEHLVVHAVVESFYVTAACSDRIV